MLLILKISITKQTTMARNKKNRGKMGARLARRVKKSKRQRNLERWRRQVKAKEMTDLIRDFVQLAEVSPMPGTYAALQEERERADTPVPPLLPRNYIRAFPPIKPPSLPKISSPLARKAPFNASNILPPAPSIPHEIETLMTKMEI